MSSSKGCYRQSSRRRPSIRKLAVAVFTIGDYVAAGAMTPVKQRRSAAVASRKNILAGGSIYAGKATPTNALLADVAGTTDRIVLIEETRDLQMPSAET